MPAPPTAPAAAPVAVRPDERWYWRAAVLVPATVAVPWAVVGRELSLPSPLPTAAGAVLVLLLAAVLVTDLRARRIPNWATYTAAAWVAVLVALAAIFGEPDPPAFGTPPPGEAVGGFVLGFVAMLVLFSVFGGGAGDVKLAAALGGLLGTQMIVSVLVYGYIVAGAFAVAFVVWRVGPLSILASIGSRLFPGRVRPPTSGVGDALRVHVPMAPFLAAGVVLALVFRDR